MAVLLAVLMGVAGALRPSLASPVYTLAFWKHYKVAREARLRKAKCLVCHLSQKATQDDLNPYGKALAALGSKFTDDKLVQALKKLELKDSDGDTYKNVDEIRADTLPGDKTSKPGSPGPPPPPPEQKPQSAG